jgi:hypothetical protein
VIRRKVLPVKKIGILLLSVITALVIVLLVTHLTTRPPSETKIIANFKNNQATYERLRDMLAREDKLRRIADWGVETDAGTEEPSKARYLVGGYDEYVELLKRLNAQGASRRAGDVADPCVLVWTAGFAGDTRHRSICWLAVAPDSRIESLEVFENSPKPRKPSFKHIEGGWYIWADW